MSEKLTHISDHLYVHSGNINVGIITDGDRALLIDFGDGSVMPSLNDLKIKRVEKVIFTHHHRGQASGLAYANIDDLQIGVPDQERKWFAEVEAYWNDPAYRWHIYNVHPHNLMLTESVPVAETYKEGDSFKWGNATISVIDTPGHTDGSLSYVVDVDGARYIFSGDVIYDKGQIWELYSLQKGETTTDYHGFFGSRKELKQSLLKLKDQSPKAIIPSHGNVINKPVEAIDLLIERLDVCYDRYVAISALRYYFPQMFTEFEGREGHMPIRSGKAVPSCLRHYGTSWFIISQNKDAFVIDCGSTEVIKEVQRLQANGDIAKVSGLWVTHYHDDHVDAIPDFQQVFDCPVYTDEKMADILEKPIAYRLPCISPSVIKVSNWTKDGESWNWNEFKMTAYHFPGQSYYHSGLLVEGQDVRMFFAGDSFTMSGIDDYCSWNRNWLGEGVGFDRCLALMQELKPTHIFNCHVDPAFDFTNEEIQFMRANLAERERIYGELFPWDSPNYGMDEYWVHCYPYEQNVMIGEDVNLHVDITNHSSSEHKAVCRPILPKSWGIEVDVKSVVIPSKSNGRITFSFTVPKGINAGKVIVPIELTYGGRNLGQFREAMLNVKVED
jgi:glyoxylase-like metal-dependent hydrolase (beta-lactamase superfamily II)